MKKLIVILAVIAMVGSFTVSAMADVSLYGSARFRTYYISNDPGTPGSTTDDDLEWRIGHLTRFGANFKSDKMTGKFELDARAGSAGATGNIEEDSGASGLGNLRLRHLWGEYDFGTFKLMIGQNFPLYDAYNSAVAFYSGGLQPLGGIGYTVARTSQIRLTFGDLRIAFLPPDTSSAGTGAADPFGIAGYNEVNTTLPKVELRYDMKMDVFQLNFIAGYQTFEIEDTTGAIGSEDIDSFVLGFRGQANFGPAYAGISATYRQNGANYGAWTVSSKESATFEGGSVKDADAIGAVGKLGFKVSDLLTLEASAAYLTTEQDTTLDNEDDNFTYALAAQLHVAPGVLIQPEFIFQDRDDVVNNGVSTEQGDVTVFGVWWKIDFK